MQEKAQYLVDCTRVVAEIDGTVLQKFVEPGESIKVDPATGAATRLHDGKSCIICWPKSKSHERDLEQVDSRSACWVSPEAAPELIYEARVERRSPVVNRQRGSVQVKVRILDPDEKLMPDMSCKVTFLSGSQSPDAQQGVEIPQVAVVTQGSSPVIFVLDGDVARQRAVTIGKTHDQMVEIASGLHVGEKVLSRTSRWLMDSPFTAASKIELQCVCRSVPDVGLAGLHVVTGAARRARIFQSLSSLAAAPLDVERMNNTLVSIENVYKDYARGSETIHVLRGVSLDIAEGEFLGLIGPSGSGKSTLLNLIAGLDKPTSGRVVIGDFVISELSETDIGHWRSHHLGFVFQFYHLIPVLSAYENVELPLLLVRSVARPAAATGDDHAGAGRPDASAEASAGRALRRRTAAGRHCPGAGDRSDPDRGRRTDRRSGRPHFGRNSRSARNAAIGPAKDDRAGDARSAGGQPHQAAGAIGKRGAGRQQRERPGRSVSGLEGTLRPQGRGSDRGPIARLTARRTVARPRFKAPVRLPAVSAVAREHVGRSLARRGPRSTPQASSPVHIPFGTAPSSCAAWAALATTACAKATSQSGLSWATTYAWLRRA